MHHPLPHTPTDTGHLRNPTLLALPARHQRPHPRNSTLLAARLLVPKAALVGGPGAQVPSADEDVLCAADELLVAHGLQRNLDAVFADGDVLGGDLRLGFRRDVPRDRGGDVDEKEQEGGGEEEDGEGD